MKHVLVMVVMALMFANCKDKCGEISCRNGGECRNNSCQCLEEYFGDECEVRCRNGADWDGDDCICGVGYEGEQCELLVRDRFVGSYEMNGYCNCGGPNPVFIDPFIINITAASDDLGLNISLLDVDVSLPIEAFISGQTFEIPSQVFDGNITISGGGEFGESFLYVSYGKITGSGATFTTETYQLIGSQL